jgi:light-regulated signal transduction histidine kinase (bacteriophytochrome)
MIEKLVMAARSGEADLTNCDREPIHIPGSIQPHGAMLVYDAGRQTHFRQTARCRDARGLGGR